MNLSCLLPAGLVACMHQVTPLINLILEFCIKFALNRIVMLLGPGTECFLQPVLLPVDEHLLHRALLLVRLPCVLQPGVEAASDLHLCHSAHVVRHDFLRQILGLGDDGQATGLDSLDLLLLVFDLQVLTLNMSRHVVSFFHISHLHIRRLNVLPLLEGSSNSVAHHAVHGAVHELPGKFKLTDVFLPGGNAVFQVRIASHQIEPIAAGCDVLTTSGCFGLGSKLVEPEPHPMLVLSLFEFLHSFVQVLNL